MKTIYVAGPLTPTGMYSKNPVIDYLTNVRIMLRVALDLFFAGFDPFVPALDFMFWFVLKDSEYITEPMIKRYSKTWLSKCDAVFLCPGWNRSKGTQQELKLAEKLGIPVFASLEDLLRERRDEEKEGGGVL